MFGEIDEMSHRSFHPDYDLLVNKEHEILVLIGDRLEQKDHLQEKVAVFVQQNFSQSNFVWC